jgi:hypothetical protein
MTVLIDRVPANPNRKYIVPEAGGPAPFYATVNYADNPTIAGNAVNLQNVMDTAISILPAAKSTFQLCMTGLLYQGMC